MLSILLAVLLLHKFVLLTPKMFINHKFTITGLWYRPSKHKHVKIAQECSIIINRVNI